MATTLGDLLPPSGGRTPMKRQATLSEALAEVERMSAELEQERERARRLEDELREARRLEAIGRLAGGVAHDFSNILAVISGYSELMLKRMDPTDPLRTGAESIRQAVREAALDEPTQDGLRHGAFEEDGLLIEI